MNLRWVGYNHDAPKEEETNNDIKNSIALEKKTNVDDIALYIETDVNQLKVSGKIIEKRRGVLG